MVSYPFKEMKARYQSFSDCDLMAALADAREAWINQEAIEREYPGNYVDKDAGWRADDFHTILGVMNERRFKSLGNCDCGCNR